MILDAVTSEYLERFLNDMRQKMINNAYLSSQRRKSTIIEKQDINAAIENVVNNKQRKTTNMKVRKMMRLTALTGVLYSLIGLLIFIFQNIEFDPKKDLGSIILGIGVSITIISCLFLQRLNHHDVLKEKSYDSKQQAQFLIVQKWTEIENLVSSKMNVKIKNFQFLLSGLIKLCEGKIEIHELADLVSLRNQIVHEDVILHNDEIMHALILESRIISILKEDNK